MVQKKFKVKALASGNFEISIYEEMVQENGEAVFVLKNVRQVSLANAETALASAVEKVEEAKATLDLIVPAVQKFAEEQAERVAAKAKKLAEEAARKAKVAVEKTKDIQKGN